MGHCASTKGVLYSLRSFKKIENDSTYKVFILTTDLNQISMLLMGLNKFFTIDKI